MYIETYLDRGTLYFDNEGYVWKKGKYNNMHSGKMMKIVIELTGY